MKNQRSRYVARPALGRRDLFDSLESRVMMAVDPEMRWMIQQAGGTTTASPALSVATNLAASNGYAKTTTPATAQFSGVADAAATAAVRVNGVATTYNAATGAWSLTNTGNAVGLKPGINRVQVRSYNAGNAEVTRKTVDVWYDDASVSAKTGTLTGANTWTAAGGPYLVTGLLTVTNGATLTIEPGTSVYFGSNNARLVVNGKLDAQGTDFQHIRFTRNPAAAVNWGNIDLRNPDQTARLKYADVEYASSTTTATSAMRVEGATLFMDHVAFGSINRAYLDLIGSSIDVRNSVFPTMTTQTEPIHGTNMLGTAGSFAIFDRNVHGATKGYQDIIDFTGGNRPGSVLRVQNSWFLGGEDDGLDLDSTDVWIENNVFEHFHQPNGRAVPESKSHAISTGNENVGTSEETIVRNYFYDNDHAVVIKDGASATIVNNTIVNTHLAAGVTEGTTSVFNLYEPRTGQYQGTRAHIQGNIFRDFSQMFELPQPFPAGHTNDVDVTLTGNFIPAATTYPTAGASINFGAGNSTADPLLTAEAGVLDPTASFVLQAGSPAIGAGPNGVDAGAVVKTGVSLSGEPAAFTKVKGATLNVGFLYGTGTNAAGYTVYKYRVNNGAYGADTPTSTPITLTGLADGTYTVYALGRADDATYQAEADVTASKTWVVDTVAPKVTSATFNYGAATQSVTVVFSEDVGASLVVGDFKVKNVKTGVAVGAGSMALAYNAATRTATLTFPGLAGGRLADGDYSLTCVAAGTTDRATNALDGNGDGVGGDDSVTPFYQLMGDANRDRTVDFNDLVVLAQNYNVVGGRAWKDGDFTGDGTVDFNDLVLMAQNYNVGLGAEPVPAPPVLPAPVTSVAEELAAVTASKATTAGVKASPAATKPTAVARPGFAVRRIR